MTEQARTLARTLLARHSGVTERPSAHRPEPTQTRVERGTQVTTSGAAHRAGRSYFADHPDVVSTNRQFGELDAFLDSSNIPRPYFHPHLGTNAAMVHMFGRHLVNFSSYDYLGMSSDPRVQKRAKDAIDTYGTSVSASRIVSGEIPLHGELEARIAAWHGVDDALVTTSGYLTNAAVVGYLLGPDDVAVCDSLVHSSIVSGTRWSGCRRINFRHNDPASLEAILAASRHKYARAMLIVEGLYSMDGDTPPLPELIAIARRYDCAVMVDEAHSFGVLPSERQRYPRGLGAARRRRRCVDGDIVEGAGQLWRIPCR